MLDLNQAREIFAQHLANDPATRWRMDAALAHVVEWAYRRGLEDGEQQTPQHTQQHEPTTQERTHP